MSQPTDPSVGELEQIVTALVGLARDRGASPAQAARLGEIWTGFQAASLSGAAPSELHRRVTSLADDLLGVDALLGPGNAPYAGFWQEAGVVPEVRHETEPPVAPLGDREGDREDDCRTFLTGEPSWPELASRGLTGALPFPEACDVIEELARVVAPGPYLQTISLLPALPADERERVAAGETSWALATGPLVMDLDTATSVAIVGGDGIFELVGAERELLAARDETRPLGVVTGGDAGRRLGDSNMLPLIRRRLLTGLAFEALGVIGAVDTLPTAAGARTLAERAARLIEADDPDAEPFAAAGKALASDLAFAISADALGTAPTRAEARLERLHERARFVRAWEATPAQLYGELGEALLAGAGT